jgi:Protein of unknown function (DUF2934)
MPKATRAKEDQETPKKRSRKAKPADGNGTDAVQPVTTAPAIAHTTPEVSAKPELEAPRNASGKAKPAGSNGHAAVEAPSSGRPVAEVKAEPATSSPARHNGHVSEEMVRRRAYELYLQRRGQGGSPEQDWFQALQEISGQHVA